MALIYKFPAAKIVAQWNEAKTPARCAEIKKAVTKAASEALANKFLAAFKSTDLNVFLQKADDHVGKNLVGKGIMPAVGKPSVPRQVLVKMLLGPQQAALLAKFDLSIHLKNK